MCLIIIKPKGVEFTPLIYKSIQYSIKGNSDGMGFAYRGAGENKLLIKKGLFELYDAVLAIQKLDIQKEDEFVFHLRMGTSGCVSKANCHPFIISKNNHEKLNDTFTGGIIEEPVLFHNGVLWKYVKRKSKFSDTYHFVRKEASVLLDIPNKDSIEETEDLSRGSRLVIMYPNKNMELIGNFVEDESGLIFSNSNYLPFYEKNKVVEITREDLDNEALVTEDTTTERDYYSEWENESRYYL